MRRIELLGPVGFLDEVFERRERVREALEILVERTDFLFEGRLKISRGKYGPQFYFRENAEDVRGRYIPKNRVGLARKVAQNQYNKRAVALLRDELELIEGFLESYAKKSVEKYFLELDVDRAGLITPVTLCNKDYAKIWLKREFKPKGFNDEAVFITTAGERVRSKSEVIIADTLLRLGVPYRYEYPVRLGEKTVYPDFYCLNLKNRKEFLWEHLGMLDNPEYVERNLKKFYNYEKFGVIPGKNMIVSFESKSLPMTPKRAEVYIREFLGGGGL